MIQIRPNAEKELQRLLNKNPSRHRLVHLTVAPGGCLEWTYQLTLTDAFNPQEATAYPFEHFTVILPIGIAPYLQDLTIDYAEDLMGGGFRFLNPDAQQTCGCGNSFSMRAELPASASPKDCLGQVH